MKKKIASSSSALGPGVRTGRPARPLRSSAQQPHEIRIVGGQWKRTKLKVLDKPGLRPTPDRVRETLFNWLGQDLTGWRCMDVFAGTGALGFEAASRGATEVVLVENDSHLVESLKATQQRLGAQAVRVVRGEGVSALRYAAPATQDLVFLDPPFDSQLHAAALASVVPALASTGLVFLEAPAPYTDEVLAPLGLRVHRYLQAGAVHAHLLGLAAR